MRLKHKASKTYPAAIILFVISLVAFLGLDYLNLKAGRKNSVLFSFFLKEKISFEVWFEQQLRPFLQQQGGPSLKIIKVSEKETKKDGLKVLLEISESDYEKLALKLKDKLKQQGFEGEIVALKENERAKTINWQIWNEKKEKVFLTFNLFKTTAALPEVPPEPEESLIFKKFREKRAAIIIDDLGDNLEVLQAIIALSRPINVAILPFSLYARETAKMAQAHGLEVMLHLPLESINSENNNSHHPIEINSKMTPEEVLAILREYFELLPEIKGVNNHMGSLITQKREIMNIILAEIKARGLFFIDSRTTDKSIAFRLAREMGLVCGQRDIFLDSENNQKFILAQVEQLIRLCQKKGKAIAIGHPYPETITLLPQIVSRIEETGIKIVPLSRLLRPE